MTKYTKSFLIDPSTQVKAAELSNIQFELIRLTKVGNPKYRKIEKIVQQNVATFRK